MSGVWDPWSMHRELTRSLAVRARFRFIRTLHRLRSPRRIVATSLTILFVAIYLANGIFVLSSRPPVDPERLRLWLSGGMVLYTVYHALRCAWSRSVTELETSPAEALWLGGGPIRRSSLAIHHVAGISPSTALKTSLLAIVLAVDVARWELLFVGVFASLLLLEILRLTLARWSASISESARLRFRFVATAIAALIVLQIIARVSALTPMGSPTEVFIVNTFVALGQTSASETVQVLSFPWIAAAQLVVTDQYGWLTILQAMAAICVLPLSIVGLVKVDARSEESMHTQEVQRLRSGGLSGTLNLVFSRSNSAATLNSWPFLDRCGVSDMASVMARQWVSVKRYRGTILFSFIVPTLLCLSPLVTGQIHDQWLFVVGGIGLCTMLLAPPALRIDFRRDLKRMLLLRSLPLRPVPMVLGQITIPVLITCLFQWTTIAVAAAVTLPGWPAVILWTGILTALALFTFATENALFLAYPHHERAEGIAMMIRAKLTFLGKAAAMLLALGLLVTWATFCRIHLPPSIAMATLVAGAVIVTWLIAILAVVATAWCWTRFDCSYDVPPN